jgi:hypothetical protein
MPGRLALATAVSLALGAVTSYLQTVLPHVLAPLANSAGSWCAVAFLLALRSRRVVEGAATGALALFALVSGYYVSAHLRGFGVSEASVAFWCAAAMTVGPALGAAAVGVRRSRGWLRVISALVLPLLLIGEGLRSLLAIADTTSPAYWTGEIVLGLVVLGWTLTATRERSTESVR